MPWLLAEDAALKAKLSGLSVAGSAVTDPILVDVRFVPAEDEYADYTFPLITLMQASVERDPERESSGFVELRALPEGYPVEDGPHFANMPTPHNIDYQVVLYTRLLQHRTELVGKLAQFEFLPERFGFLEVPNDNTIRRMDMLGGPDLSSGRDRDDKRLFTATYRIRISSELFLMGGPTTFPTVETVNLDVDDQYPGPPGI